MTPEKDTVVECNVHERQHHVVDSPELLTDGHKLSDEEIKNLIDDLCLPTKLNPDHFRDFGFDVARKFYNLLQDHKTKENPAFGSDQLLLEIVVRPCGLTPETATVYWHGNVSHLWHNRHHFHRDINARKVLETGCCKQGGQEWLKERINAILLPWEKWQTGLEYTRSSDGDKWSQAKHVSFPTLDLTSNLHQFRLLILLPSFGENASPIHGCLVVSTLYLHSCFIAVRHARGNPGFRGEMFIDGQRAEITRNLELFLRHVRHPTQCRVLYIREVCINRQDNKERTKLLTGRFHALVEDCSCGILEVNRVMEMLDDEGHLPEPERTTKKLWYEVPPGAGELPWHKPMILKQYNPHLTVDKRMASEAEIATFPSYQYVPLDVAAREIRLLGVYPTHDPDDPIVVDIYHVPLRSNVHYHALSYCWGSTKVTRYLRDWDTKIGVTENLYAALLQFRSSIPHDNTIPWCIWADAVCIDQNNDAEKGRYIPRMHDIYEAAVIVLISVGSMDNVTHAARRMLEDFANNKIEEASEDKPIDELGSVDAWADVYSLLRLPYFSRRWIVQELVSASAPLVMMGDGTQDRALRTLSRAAAFMAHRFDELFRLWTETKHPIARRFQELVQMRGKDTAGSYFSARDRIDQQLQQVKTLDYIRSLRIHGELPSFLFLAVSTQSTECSDPRDIIYSLWNISQERSSSSLRFAYDSSVEDCYVNFTKAYISQTGVLDIICVSQFPAKANCVKPVNDPGWKLDLDLPSWCPDYRQNGLVSSLIRRVFLHRSTHSLRPQPGLDLAPYHADALERDAERRGAFRVQDRTMIVQGVVLDTVKFVSMEPHSNTPVQSIDAVEFRWISDLYNEMTREGSGAESEKFSTRPDELGSTTDQEGRFEASLAREQEERDALLTDFLSMVVGEPSGTVKGLWESEVPRVSSELKYRYTDRSALQNFQSFAARAAQVIKGRRLIVTQNGYMGLAPWHVREGFKLAILCGCSVPVLLENVQGAAAQSTKSYGIVTPEDESKTFTATHTNVTPGWYFRGDCFVQDWMEGQMIKRFGGTTDEVWANMSGADFELQIN